MFSKFTSSLKLHLPELRLPEFELPSFNLPAIGLPQLSTADCQTLAVLGFFATLLALEAPSSRAERRPQVYRQSYLANLGTFFLNDTLLSLLSVSSLWLVAEHYAGWGLLSGLRDSFWKAALSFLLLDLTLYGWHRANHTFDWLWLFHKVHHSDPAMNVTTAFRLHIVEVLLTTLVKALFIVVVGVDATLVLANEAIITVFVMFHHSNLAFRGERWLAHIAIVPALHRVHHSARREEHDHNYGFVLSLWDAWFGTLADTRPAAMGLRGVDGQNAWQLLKFGFTWRTTPRPSPLAKPQPPRGSLLDVVKFGLSPAHAPKLPNPSALQAMIAEAAYFRAEKRGFAPGDEFHDWVEAEREILRHLAHR
ncbi:Sterol desaturase/sphingolipid hydroxylase, fatty acid hydroxylase superfamily [Methylomagnum ishizawai]|uniref:Sterol desaturase/sphingolipid hydroxylase, fatty acid hydroxylase superfamily n=1 Tax=Methylomagnum ishizawai TaxID=1760988 RepID=A0A1Y6CT01_9GAMM|nr:sterol desaturase family protein [Methylomagnum ishizawai]SMF93330.1 Sterol desaturase/sphingolipid hydroxylase, fatty acid hydroxylase superfamily [Methylomagnum ishizawai]